MRLEELGPAIPAAGAITENIPAPRIAANPVATASKRFSCGRNLEPSTGAGSTTPGRYRVS